MQMVKPQELCHQIHLTADGDDRQYKSVRPSSKLFLFCKDNEPTSTNEEEMRSVSVTAASAHVCNLCIQESKRHIS